ncbi:hypothetical protein C2S52_001169 [Perilla frutescens var. hirtella]|nr:hypothetical protein C2S52_001169 [Perilla frutescens var. hirtella]
MFTIRNVLFPLTFFFPCTKFSPNPQSSHPINDGLTGSHLVGDGEDKPRLSLIVDGGLDVIHLVGNSLADIDPFFQLEQKIFKISLALKSKKPLEIFPLFLLISTILHLITPSKSVADYTNIVYEGCAKQSLPDSIGVYSQSLSSIYGTLLAQSSKSKFFNTSTGSGQSSISGLFQCSGFAQIFGMEMLYKSCGVTNVGEAGFEDMRDTALNSLENGMSSSNGTTT